MQRKFLINLILLIAINLLVKPLAIFGIDAEVQNRIGYEEYGIYFSLFNFTYLFNILLDVGITNFNIKNVAQHPKLSKRYIGKLISLRFLLFVFYTLIILGTGLLIGFRGERIQILIFLIINQFLLSFIQFFRSYFSGMLLFIHDAFFSVFDKLLLIFICGYYLYYDTETAFTIYHFIFSQTVSFVISIGVLLLILSRKIGFSEFKIRPNFSIAIFKQALPFALLILTMNMYTRLDAVLLERIHPNGEFQAGLYAQAYRILDAFVMFTLLFNTLLFPIFSAQIAKRENLQPLLMTASKLIFLIALSVVFGASAFAGDILELFYRDLHVHSELVFKILIVAFIPISAIQVFGTLHTSSGNLRFLNLISIIGIAISIGLNLLFIPKFGAIGAAYVCVITHLVIALTQIIFTKTHFKFLIAWKTIGSLLIFGGALYFIPLGLKNLQLSFAVNLFIYGLSAVTLAMFLRIIHLKDIRQFIKARG